MSCFECYECLGTGSLSGDGCMYCDGTGIVHEEEIKRGEGEISPSLQNFLDRLTQQNNLLGDLIKELKEIPPGESPLEAPSQETFRVLGEIGKLLKDTPRITLVCHEDDFEKVSVADPLAGTLFAVEIRKTTLVAPGTLLISAIDPKIYGGPGSNPVFDLRKTPFMAKLEGDPNG